MNGRGILPVRLQVRFQVSIILATVFVSAGCGTTNKTRESEKQAVTYNDLNIRIYDSTAVVIGREKLRTENAGKEESASYRFTAAFVKQGNQWRCVASHSSPIRAVSNN